MRKPRTARRPRGNGLVPIKRADIDPPAIFRRLHRPLGAVAFAFADIEGQLSKTLNVLVGGRGGSALDDLMQSFTARTRLFHFLAGELAERRVPTPRTGMINWPLSKGSVELRETAKKLSSCLMAANNDRNHLFHTPWDGLSPDLSYSKTRMTVADGKFTETWVRGITPALLDAEADYLLTLAWRLADWRQRAIYWAQPDLWPEPLPETLPQRSPLGSLFLAQKEKEQKRPRESSRR